MSATENGITAKHTVNLNRDVVPVYEHIANADFHALARVERIVIPGMEIDEEERSLLLKAVAARRQLLRSMAAAVETEIMADISGRFQSKGKR